MTFSVVRSAGTAFGSMPTPWSNRLLTELGSVTQCTVHQLFGRMTSDAWFAVIVDGSILGIACWCLHEGSIRAIVWTQYGIARKAEAANALEAAVREDIDRWANKINLTSH
jgi:hypothetical protein